MSQGRLIIITTFLIIVCMVALGLGLGFVLTKNKDNDPTPCGKVVTVPKTLILTPPFLEPLILLGLPNLLKVFIATPQYHLTPEAAHKLACTLKLYFSPLIFIKS